MLIYRVIPPIPSYLYPPLLISSQPAGSWLAPISPLEGTAVILGAPFVPSNEDGLAGCYGEGRLGDAWLSATHLQRETDGRIKLVGGRGKERIWEVR